MRASLLILLSALALASCDKKTAIPPIPRDITSVNVQGFTGAKAGDVAGALGITEAPNEYRYLPLPAPSRTGQTFMGMVPWKVFEKARKANALGDLIPANITDLLALQASSEGKKMLARYKRACAPEALFDPYMPVISDGARMGLYSSESCEWAIVVLSMPEKQPQHVL
ncbi:MAG: hypothetical protein KA104_02230 [Candidatus Pacebacteria bacterium]|nr:hypothetical protein [Candidatus Paceibacterota bacterium]